MQLPQPRARYERKYLIPVSDSSSIEQIISLHPAQFQEIYYPRLINNIYFDNQKFDCFQANQAGDSQRYKIRLRWYSHDLDTMLEQIKPHLEIKLKQADLVTKYIFKKQHQIESLIKKLPVSIQQKTIFADEHQVSNDSSLKEIKNKQAWQSLIAKADFFKPVLLNSYSRKYYVSADQAVRLTVDKQIRFHPISQMDVDLNLGWSLPITVVEMKADLNYSERLSQISKDFPFQLTRSSKYTMGMNCCYLTADQYQLEFTPRPLF